MIGLVSLPIHTMPLADGFSNLNGWWKAPSFVNSFWASACEITFDSAEDYDSKKKEVLKSYNECIQQFFRENVL